MFMGVLEYRSTLHMLGAGRILRLGRMTVVLALVIMFTGVGLFVAIAFHAI